LKELAHTAELPQAYADAHQHGNLGGVMRGGTNLEILPFVARPGLSSFVGFPRTHTNVGCDNKATYRPEMVILTTNGTHSYIDYSSQALHFGHSVLTPAQISDPCGKGRILLPSSIARFDDDPERDTMTMTFTVADSTVQVVNIRGVRRLVEGLPPIRSVWMAGT